MERAAGEARRARQPRKAMAQDKKAECGEAPKKTAKPGGG